MIRRIDFSFVVGKDAKQAKISKETVTAAAQQPSWPWQGLVENLQLAHQELSVIIDLINTVGELFSFIFFFFFVFKFFASATQHGF